MAGKKQLVAEFPADELWLPIPGHHDAYEASDRGRIRVVALWRHGKRHALNAPRLLRPDIVAGYHRVNIGLVHRLVLFAFKGLPNKGMESCHANGDRLDNHPANLRWGTRQENIAERGQHGRNSVGEKNGCARFTENDIREIRATYRRTSYRQSNVRELMARFNADRSTLLNIIRRKSWAHI